MTNMKKQFVTGIYIKGQDFFIVIFVYSCSMNELIYK